MRARRPGEKEPETGPKTDDTTGDAAELLRPIEELPDGAPPPSGAADGRLFAAARRPCRNHDARPVPPVGRPVVVALPLAFARVSRAYARASVPEFRAF
jgi:hypothetical protein